MTTLSAPVVWTVMAAIGVGTWLLRISFLALLGRVDQVPPSLSRVLRYIPAAVLAALVLPALTHATGGFDLATDRFAAGAVAALVAWRTRNVLATITVGMVCLWMLQAI
ncbi:MAG TPA: AzlD domain-containing protein [Acidimicrobiia bacterium]|nr:AzlD domain-containing protein [Acidimicrobiia bacterium]